MEVDIGQNEKICCTENDKNSEDINEQGYGHEDTPGGTSNVRLKIFKKCVTLPAFVGFYSFACIVKDALRHIIVSQVPTVEKQFGLKSYLSGFLISLNEIGYLGVCLFLTPLAPYAHVPRTIFATMVLVGVSGIMSGLPHFVNRAAGNIPDLTTGKRQNISMDNVSRHQNIQLCTSRNASLSDNTCADIFDAEGEGVVHPSIRTMFLILIGTGMVLQGVSKSIHMPFIATYIDNGQNKRKIGLYIGIIIGFKIIGPMLAFLFGSLSSHLYLTLEAVDITPEDPRWVGAWWLGFIVFGIASCISSVPLSFFPRSLEGENTSTFMVKGKPLKCLSRKEKIKERLTSYCRVLSVPEFVCFLLAHAVHIIAVEGYYSFISKYIQTQFNQPLWKANMITALADLFPAVLGTFVGGILTRWIKLTPRKIFGLLMFFSICNTCIFLSGFIFGCNQPSVVGPQSIHGVQANNFTDCSRNCNCKADKYLPICGSNGISFHSPCYAGCENSLNSEQTFNNCTCISDGNATVGLCDSGCNNLIPFCFSCALSSLVSTMAISPGYIAQIRSVHSRDKSTAIGLAAFFTSLIGFLPAPIIYGKVVDSACLLWQGSCSDNQGACLFYDIEDFRIKIFGLGAGLKAASITCLIFAFLFIRKHNQWHQNL